MLRRQEEKVRAAADREFRAIEKAREAVAARERLDITIEQSKKKIITLKERVELEHRNLLAEQIILERVRRQIQQPLADEQQQPPQPS